MMEHLEISLVELRALLTQINHYTFYEIEHLDINFSFKNEYNEVVFKLGQPQIRTIRNLPNLNNDWGYNIEITIDRHLNRNSLLENISSFRLMYSRYVEYAVESIIISSDGLTIIFVMTNFNSAQGQCIFSYTPGNLYTQADVLVESLSTTFTPQNLVPPSVPIPVVTNIWNV